MGILLAMVRQVFSIDRNVFLLGYWIAGAAVLVLLAAVGRLYYGKYQRGMVEAAKLREEGKTEEYIAQVEKLLESAKGQQLRNQLRLNLTAGYCDLKQYDRAAAILEELAGEKLKGVVRTVHRLNLCCCYFYMGEWEKAMEWYGKSQGEFASFRNTAEYGGNVAVLDIFAEIARGQKERAGEMLENAKETWRNPRLQEDYQYLERLL